jgi:tetratricopeptide (TPR) repeat protein
MTINLRELRFEPEWSNMMRNKYFHAGAVLSFLIALIFYLKTMAVSASFWDSGEFIATAYTLGIPHSPGTPLYILVSRVFTTLPLPLTIAQKVNLLSVVCGALGVLFLYLLVIILLEFISGKVKSKSESVTRMLGALAGSLFIAFSSTYWTNAIEAEVYALSCFLMGFMTWLALKWAVNPMAPKATAIIYLLFYFLALSVGFHLGTMLAFSGIFFLILLTKKKTFSNAEFIIACIGMGIFVADATLYRAGHVTLVMLILFALLLGWLYYKKSPFALICTGLFILGLSVHLYLLIRSGQNPAMDMGDPEEWRSLYAVLRREQYPPIAPFARKASLLFQLQHFSNYFQDQFQMFVSYIGKLNVGSIFPIGIGIWGMVEHFTKHKQSFITIFITFIVTSIGLVAFLNFSDSEVRDRDYFYSPAFYYFAIFIGIGTTSVFSELRKALVKWGRKGVPAYALTGTVLIALPFLTVKHQYFTHDRSQNYTCQDFSKNMLVGLKKDAILFTHGDNDTYPLWYIQEVENYRKDVRIVNLQLVNLPWYIKQLRDNDPKLPIRWSDGELERLTPVRTKDGILLVSDRVVLHILRENRWRRPIYFSVTIPPEFYEPYREHLEMQGLVYEVVKEKGGNMINTEVLEDSVYNKFNYRSILTKNWERDRSVYLPRHTEHLIQNYAFAFVQLAYKQQDEPEKALRAMKIAHEISPRMEPVVQMLGKFYFLAGDTKRAVDHYQEMIHEYPDNLVLLYRAAEIYERMGEAEKALRYLDEFIEKDPGNRQVVLAAFGLAARANSIGRARNYLTTWLRSHPGDTEAAEMLRELDAAVKQ